MNKLFVSNERDQNNVPSVLRLNPNARVDRSLKLPSYYLPAYDGEDQVSASTRTWRSRVSPSHPITRHS